MKKQHINLLGVAGLGLTYPSMKEALGGGAVFAAVILIERLMHRATLLLCLIQEKPRSVPEL